MRSASTSPVAWALTCALVCVPACERVAHGSGAEAEPAATPSSKRVEVIVDATGYHPATIRAPARSRLTLAFRRTTEAGCGQQLVFETLGIRKQLPLDKVVEVEVEVPERGELGFACGMNMYRGKVVPTE
ncbi:MAG TPA: cupredoxin domain-containing protein [Enhygromyxa sp.]|nr:cupredoxin domain-containing protein [Enhygromyxa sp.]